MKKIIVLAVTIALFQAAVKADAAPIVLESAGGGVYVLNAVDLPEVGGIDVEIEYDRVNLANPRISAADMLVSTMFMTNTDCDDNAVKSGSCHKLHNIKVVAAASIGVKGSGKLATIEFDLIGGTPEAVFIVRQATSTFYGKKSSEEDKKLEEERLRKLEEERLKLEADKREADRLAKLEADRLEAERLAKLEADRLAKLVADKAAEDDRLAKLAADKAEADRLARLAAGTGTGGATTVTSNGASPSIGNITLPLDQMASTERKPDYQPLVTDLRKDMNVPLGGKEASADAGTAAPANAAKDKVAEKTFEFFNGAVDLFKAYKGEKTMKALISLFAYAELKGYTQTPPVAIADGTTPLSITLVLKVAADESPSFVMQGATITQLSRDMEKSTWTIQAVPKKDAVDARMTIIDGPRMLDYPLTVTPKIDPLLTKGKQLSDADFALYLTKPPKFDLNGDKKFDALDDYVYTANYILAMKIKPEKSAKPEAKEKSSKPEAKEIAPADKQAAPAGKESKTKDSTLKDEESAPAKAPVKK